MALRAMCKCYTLLTPSPSGESPTTQWPYWYRLSVTELLMFPMWMLPSEYGAGAGHVSVGPPLGLWGGGATVGLAVTDNWFVSVITNSSESSRVDSTNYHFWQSRLSLVLAISCRCFPSWEVLLWAILARACAAYSSSLAAWVSVRVLQFTNFLTAHQKNLDQIYILSVVFLVTGMSVIVKSIVAYLTTVTCWWAWMPIPTCIQF